jgi:hypothetical protein
VGQDNAADISSKFNPHLAVATTVMHLSFRYRIQCSLGLKQHNFQIVDTIVMHLTFRERIQCSLGLKQHDLQNHISVKIKIH